MPFLLWDASALAKRYIKETGTSTVGALFAMLSAVQMLSTFTVYVETLAMILRRRNGGDITSIEVGVVKQTLQEEVLLSTNFTLLNVETPLVLASVDYVLRHNLNSSDAAILATFLSFAQAQPDDCPPCILVASDLRLLRAAAAEGLATLNPELIPAADVPAFLASHAKNNTSLP